MGKRGLTIAFLLWSSLAYSLEVRKIATETPGKIFYTLYSEAGHFQLTAVRALPAHLPRLVWRKHFSDRAAALHEFSKLPGQEIGPLKDLGERGGVVATESPNAVIWPVKEMWTVQWEQRFRDWIEREVDAQFMVNNYIATDCADVAFAFRWIFARIHGLPAANRLAATGELFTQDSMAKEWQNLPTNADWRNDERFFAALNYILEMTYTHSLILDSYPIEIQPTTLMPGAIFLYMWEEDGHTLFIHRMTDGKQAETPLRTLNSTVPKTVRELDDTEFYEAFQPTQPANGGFIRFRWPEKNAKGEWQLRPGDKMPGFSLEQYDPEVVAGVDFDTFVFDRIAPDRKQNPEARLTNLVTQIMTLFHVRRDVVVAGYEHCYPNKCAPNTPAYQNWSTPARDQRLLDRIRQALKIVATNPNLNSTWMEQISSEYVTIFNEEDSRTLYLETLVDIWTHSGYSSDPNSPIFARWGIRN